VFVDERDDLVNWGNYMADMTGYSPANPAGWGFSGDMPGMYHDRAASFSFVDGHGEIKHWTDPRTTPPYGTALGSPGASPNNPDVYWIQDHSTRLK
jgi:prepilin-type processing-associated H-X9-DG protein